MVLPAPQPESLAPARRPRSFESRGLHFIEHHQRLIWALIAAVSTLVVMTHP